MDTYVLLGNLCLLVGERVSGPKTKRRRADTSRSRVPALLATVLTQRHQTADLLCSVPEDGCLNGAARGAP